jgi:Zn-dependent peptidase ImmA (M78 family)/transcriptional regulator with XRE-family HTH domain
MLVEHYNKEILLWGIERAGFRLDEFLARESRVEEWLYGNKYPTVKQLETIANTLHFPFGYLFFDNPPQETIDFPFFRTMADGAREVRNVSLNVYQTIQIVESRQEWLRDYFVENGNEPLEFVGRYNTKNNPLEVAADIRRTLNLDELWANGCNTLEDALNYLTEVVEEAGIIVSFNGVVGNSTKRPIPVDECRGFVLVDDIVPFMFINNSDSKAAQVFTIAHELAHVWIGHSAGFDFRNLNPANDEKELFCDRVAAEFLVPAELFKSQWAKSHDFQKLNRFFKVSPIVMRRRALDLGFISKHDFFSFYNEYSAKQYHKQKESGGDFYLTTRKRISPTFAAHINNGVKSGRLLYKDAYRLTGMHGETFSKFFKRF